MGGDKNKPEEGGSAKIEEARQQHKNEIQRFEIRGKCLRSATKPQMIKGKRLKMGGLYK